MDDPAAALHADRTPRSEGSRSERNRAPGTELRRIVLRTNEYVTHKEPAGRGTALRGLRSGNDGKTGMRGKRVSRVTALSPRRGVALTLYAGMTPTVLSCNSSRGARWPRFTILANSGHFITATANPFGLQTISRLSSGSYTLGRVT